MNGAAGHDRPHPQPLSRGRERGEFVYVGIDDTDVHGSLGTKRLAGMILGQLLADFRGLLVVRHQLLFDPRVPYTSKNSAASLIFDRAGVPSLDGLAARLREVLRAHYVEGSDPGLCVTDHVPAEATAFGRLCQQDVVRQDAARALAARHGIYLEGLAGTQDGVIGALAAVGLAACGDDGRVVQITQWPDDLSGPQDAALLYRRGIDEIRAVAGGARIDCGSVDVGKHLRPNRRGGRVVLLVAPSVGGDSPGAGWRAVRQM